MTNLKPSIRQMQLVDSLVKHINNKYALAGVARDLKISRQAVYVQLYRLREGYNDRLEFVEWYRKKRKELAKPGRYL